MALAADTKDDSGMGPAPFLTKTFEMVDDPATNRIVCWSGDDSFIVKDPGEFSTKILPCYFKHNNLSSFVRQLNIYGFRKVNSDSWEFGHPKFRRGWFDLLKDIKRRKTAPKDSSDGGMPAMQMGSSQEIPSVDGSGVQGFVQDTLINEVAILRQQQESSQRILAATLNELHETRCEQQRSQDKIDKLLGLMTGILDCKMPTDGSAQQESSNRAHEEVQSADTQKQHVVKPDVPFSAQQLAEGLERRKQEACRKRLREEFMAIANQNEAHKSQRLLNAHGQQQKQQQMQLQLQQQQQVMAATASARNDQQQMDNAAHCVATLGNTPHPLAVPVSSFKPPVVPSSGLMALSHAMQLQGPPIPPMVGATAFTAPAATAFTAGTVAGNAGNAPAQQATLVPVQHPLCASSVSGVMASK